LSLRGVSVLLLPALLVPRFGLACPCSDDAGSSVSLARPDERWAVAVAATSRYALGRFDARGRYHALRAGEAESSEELLLRAALRLPPRLEWLAELGYASYRSHAAELVEKQAGVGDVALRARYSLVSESMPHEATHWPALALSGLLRAPLGSLARERSTSFGSGGPQLGLGAWEAGGGIDASRSLASWLDVSLGAEAAYRFEDDALSKARRLGPRLETALGARVSPNRWLSGSCALRARVTGDVRYGGQTLPETGERLLGVVVGGAVYDEATGFRAALTLSLDPPVRLFSANATAAGAVGVALAYGRH
jgi:hypothetical protein